MSFPYPFLNKSHYTARWFLLSFCVWIVAGAFYCFDVPSALHNTLKTHFQGVVSDSAFEIYFSGLYSVYSFANIFLPLITGRLRDNFGDRLILLFTTFLVLIGQFIFAYGVQLKSFFIMYIGRIIVGWGIESVQPIQTSFISPYFKDDYLSFSIGMNSLFAGFGSVITMYYCPVIAIRYGLIPAVLSGAAINVGCLICSIISTTMDKVYETALLKEIDYDRVKFMEIAQEEHHQQEEMPAEIGEIQSISSFEQIKSFPKLYWLSILFFSLNYSSVLGFTNVSVGFLSEWWLGMNDESEERAGELVAIMWFISGAFSPLFGYTVDTYGGRAYYCIAAAIMCSVAHVMILYVYPFFSLILLGIANTIAYAAPWTGVVYLVRPDALGKAYAILVGFYNAMFTITPLLVGLFRANFGNYYYSQIFLASLGIISFIISLMIKQEDDQQDNILDGNGRYSISQIEEQCKLNRSHEQNEDILENSNQQQE